MGSRIFSILIILTVLFACVYTSEIQCQTSDDCSQLYECMEGKCQHKPIFPLTIHEIVGSVLIVLFVGLSNVAGIGGASLLSPILLVCFHYNASKSIMIVYAMVFGGAFGNYLNVAFLKDPQTGKGYVEYDLSLICVPLMLIGTNIGVLLNKICPSILTILGLMGLMIYTIKTVYPRAQVHHARESLESQTPLLTLRASERREIEMKLLASPKTQKAQVLPYPDPNVTRVLEEENSPFPQSKLRRIEMVVLWILAMGFLRGTDHLGSLIGVDYCGFGYWSIYLLSLVGCYYLYLKNKEYVRKIIQFKVLHGLISDNELDTYNELSVYLPRLSAVAGVLAGLLGIGGGMVLGPPLLEHFSPLTVGATSGFFVVQTSFVASFLSIFHGGVTLEEVAFFLTISFIGSYGVSSILTYIVKKYEKPSLILFSLIFALSASLVVLPVFAIWKSFTHPEEMFQFKSLC